MFLSSTITDRAARWYLHVEDGVYSVVVSGIVVGSVIFLIFLFSGVGAFVCIIALNVTDLTCPRRPDEFESGDGSVRCALRTMTTDLVHPPEHHWRGDTVGTDSSLCLLGPISNLISFRVGRCIGNDSGVCLCFHHLHLADRLNVALY